MKTPSSMSVWKWKQKPLSHVRLFETPQTIQSMEFSRPRILVWVAFPFSRGSSQPRDQTQVSCIAGGFFYQLSHKGSPRILEWIAYSFSKGSSWPTDWTGVTCTAGKLFTISVYYSPKEYVIDLQVSRRISARASGSACSSSKSINLYNQKARSKY